MWPVPTLRLASFDDSQHAVLLVYMLHQFAHRGTISVPTDSAAPVVQGEVTPRRPLGGKMVTRELAFIGKASGET